MSAHSLLLLDTSSSLADDLKSLSNALFQVPVIITALVLTFVFAILAWIIAYVFLRPKETCSFICSIHFLLTVGAIILGLASAIGLIDHNYPGNLITGAGVALLILTIPLFILAESFNYVVLSNKHARAHRELRTAQDRGIRRGVVFVTPLAIGIILLVVGLLISAAGIVLSAITQVIILLLILWVLAMGAELLILAAAGRRRRQMAAVSTGAALNREEVATIWVRGFSSYRIGRGETVFTSSEMTVQDSEDAWGSFTHRVYITEELLLEEDGELDLVEVEEAESVSTYTTTGAAAVALHAGHRNQRHPAQNRFFRRWGMIMLLLIVAVVAVAFTVAVGTVAAWTTAGIALAFLAPVIYLFLHRMRRDSELHFATETAQKVSTAPTRGFTPPAGGVTPPASFAAPAASPAAPRTRGASGALPAVAPLHPARPVPVNPPIAEPQIPPREEPDAPTLPSVDTSGAAGAAHENPDIADDTIIGGVATGAAGVAAGALLAGAGSSTETDTTTTTETDTTETTVTDTTTTTASGSAGAADTRTTDSSGVGLGGILAAGAAGVAAGAIIAGAGKHTHDDPEADEDTLLIGHTSTSPASDTISATDFQHYLRGIHYPATRAQLIAQARANNAPPNMIARLEVLDEGYTFTSVSEVMRGYAYHRYFSDVTYPATRDQLLAHARTKNAPSKLIIWLESLEVTVVFVSLVEVMRRYTTHLQNTGQEDTGDATLLDAAPEASDSAPAAAPAAPAVSSRIGIIEFQRYLHGVDYPVTRAQLIAQAQANNAPPNMIARLQELDETHSFVSVRDVMIGYAYHRYLSGVTYPATRDQLLAHARANKAPSKLIIWIESLAVTVTFVNLTEVVRSYASHQREEVEEELEEEVVESPPPPPAPAPAVSSRIGIIEFQRYLHGVDYPVTRAQLIAQAQANNATPNMIARLQELDETHSFVNVRDVMIGYAYHRYLSGVTYPATRDQLLAHARANKAPSKLIGWLETLEVTVTFATLTEVVRTYATYRVEEEEDEEEDQDDEKTITIARSAGAGEGSKGIGFREFSHFLRGIHYPATRDQLLAQARTNSAPAAMIARLEELPPQHEFKGMADVMRGYGHHIAEDGPSS